MVITPISYTALETESTVQALTHQRPNERFRQGSHWSLLLWRALAPPERLGEQQQSCPAFQQCLPRHSATSSFGNIWVVSWGQNRPQETPLVGSQREKVARGKTHKQNTLWVVNSRVRHLLKAICLESFYCYTGIGAVPVNKEITNQAPRGRHYQQRTCVCLSWNHTPGLPWQGGDWCKGNELAELIRDCNRFPRVLAHIQPRKKCFACFIWVQQVQIRAELQPQQQGLWKAEL